MSAFNVDSARVLLRDVVAPQHPLATEALILPKGHQKRPGCRPLPSNIVLERDQALTLRDGTKIFADIYRPETDQNTQVPAIVMWSPYGKSSTGLIVLSTILPFQAGIPDSQLSGYESFEGLDPAEWVPRGYAIVNIDARGSNHSEGNMRWFGSAEGRDGHDAIEEIAKLDWCNGKVGMAGNSWLAAAQYYVAVEKPAHLACIAPLEGFSDPVREMTLRGGIPHTSFSKTIANTLTGTCSVRATFERCINFIGTSKQEDLIAMVQDFNNFKDYFEDKRVDFSKIDVPAYIGASYSTDIHTIGSLRAFEEIPHDKKWIVLHASQEWYDLYSVDRTRDLSRFFDYYLKGIANHWLETKPARVALLRYPQPALLDQEFEDLPWHLPSASKQQLFLDSQGGLSVSNPAESSTQSYRAESSEALTFSYRFSSRTVIIGPSTLSIHIASPAHDDMDIYAHIFKADAKGNTLTHMNIPISPEEAASTLTENKLFRYRGPTGCLRASRRHVSPQQSGKTWHTLSFSRVEPVKPGDIVKLDIQMWPTGIVFGEGERLILKVSGKYIGLPSNPGLELEAINNRGQHVVYTGGEFASSLQFYTL
ncbi:unnamed protein product [Clonostachys byssicola]|uniref:Xaa-Pro dipeptidyl-peptidase C-terminal domain-containing protein n=1 Tax=Clonostachys byssicola TaxID=160290 RepID=A0A9N9Y0L6_9HYPO|nr:unnamed protein product [Clonostachys byssicola]